MSGTTQDNAKGESQSPDPKIMNTPTDTRRDSVEFTALFADLVRLHGEENGGSEDFFINGENRIGCRYADLSMHRKDDGWHYGQLPEAYPTPAECYEHRREDEARFHSPNTPVLPLSDEGAEAGATDGFTPEGGVE